jgi:hypothetical protein
MCIRSITPPPTLMLLAPVRSSRVSMTQPGNLPYRPRCHAQRNAHMRANLNRSQSPGYNHRLSVGFYHYMWLAPCTMEVMVMLWSTVGGGSASGYLCYYPTQRDNHCLQKPNHEPREINHDPMEPTHGPNNPIHHPQKPHLRRNGTKHSPHDLQASLRCPRHT